MTPAPAAASPAAPVDAAASARRPASMLAPWLLAAGLIALRNPTALFRAEFWAEDGTVFFRDALLRGAASLAMPVYGYCLSLARAIAWVATFFPVVGTPYVYAVAALAVNAFTVAYLSRPGFEWLIPKRAHRILVACLLTLAPGAGETFLNISNLTNCLGLLALLMLIETPRELGALKFAALVAIGLSSGHMVILLPLILYLWVRDRRRSHLFLLIALFPIVAANFLGNQRSGAATGLLDYSRFLVAPLVIVENFVVRLFFAPFLGSELTGGFMKTPAWVFWPLALGALAAAAWGVRRARPDRETTRILVLSDLLTVSTFGIIVVSRSYAFEKVQRESGNIMWGVRYSFLPGVMADLIWMAALIALARGATMGTGAAGVGAAGGGAGGGNGRRVAWLARAAIVVLCFNNVARWHGVYRRHDAHWPESAARVQAVLDRRARGELQVPTEVPGIQMHPMGTGMEWLTVTIPPSDR
ncbi:MAG TPA: hypothetical protein VFB49_10510 [Patescibacteria group bacterium]|nr:hypothetical protein [Patescibacteria group bacterium]